MMRKILLTTYYSPQEDQIDCNGELTHPDFFDDVPF
jgi:hypothetical protein